MMTDLADNPYVGPQPFTRDQADRFFGREKEAADLLSLVLSEQLVLFYAQSGAGKSSLLTTRVIPQLEQEDFFSLPVARVSGELPQGVEDVDNIFVFNLILSLDQSHEAPERFAHMRLSQFLAHLTTDDGKYYYYAEPQGDQVDRSETPQPPHLLVIDQFEEILTTNLARWPEREDFFRQLDQAMQADPMLWVLLTMREDHVAALRPYARQMQELMRARFYMKRMEAEAALQAIEQPAILGGKRFAEGVAKTLVNNLRQIKVQGSEKSRLGQYIEPVQLQVVCYQLWENLKGTGREEITHLDLEELGNVDIALSQFYEQVIRDVLDSAEISEIELRGWFDSELITEAETRGTVYLGPEETAGLPNHIVQLLANRFLLRAEIRAGGTWYELVHDRFVDPILQANRAWRQRQSPLIQAAEDWNRAGRPRDRLYQGNQVEEALRDIDLESQQPLVREFLQASQEAQSQRELEEREAELAKQRRTNRLLTTLAVGLLLAIIASVIFAGLAVIGRNDAERNEALAEENAALAESERAKAEANAALAQENAELAATNETVSYIVSFLFEQQLDTALEVAADNLARYEALDVAPETAVAVGILQSISNLQEIQQPNKMLSVMETALEDEPALADEFPLELANFYNQICARITTANQAVVLPACASAVQLAQSLPDLALRFEVCQQGKRRLVADSSVDVSPVCALLPGQPRTIEMGGSGTGQVDAGQGELWSFQGDKGSVVSISMVAENSGLLDSVLSLYGPDGQKVATDDESGGNSNALINGQPLSQTGTYTVITSSFFQGQSGAYRLDLNDGFLATGEIGLEVEIVETLQPNQTHFWTFEGSANQNIAVIVQPAESLDFVVSLTFYDSNGERLEQAAAEFGVDVFLPVVLPETGEYTVAVSELTGAGGSYMLVVIDEDSEFGAEYFGGNLQIGTSVQDQVFPDELVIYVFEGTAGQEIGIRMSDLDSGIDPFLELYGPDGNLLSQDDDSAGVLDSLISLSLTQSGSYTIVAQDISGLGGSFILELLGETLEAVEGGEPDKLVETFIGELAIGESISFGYEEGEGSVIHIWNFEGSAGEQITVRLSAENSEFDAFVQIWDPDGEFLAEDGDSGGGLNAALTITLPSSGTYEILVYDDSGTNGDYLLELTGG